LRAWHTTAVPFALDHPCLAGHFPGHPIIPGTLILECVVESLTAQHPETEVCEISHAKFLHPLQPGVAFTIHYQEKPGEALFECHAGENKICTGKLKLTHAGPQT